MDAENNKRGQGEEKLSSFKALHRLPKIPSGKFTEERKTQAGMGMNWGNAVQISSWFMVHLAHEP